MPLPTFSPDEYIDDTTPQTQSTPGFWSSLFSNVNPITAAMGTAGSIAGTVGDVYSLFTDPSLDQGNKVAHEVGSLGAGIAGAGTGAMFGGELGLLGGPLAPITVPIGTVAGGAIGGAGGLLGFDLLNQATGSDAPTTPQEDLAKLGALTGQGVALGGVTEGIRQAAVPALEGISDTYTGKSLGADTVKDTKYSYLDDTGAKTTPSAAAEKVPMSEIYKDTLVNNNILGDVSAPSELSLKMDKSIADTGTHIGNLVDIADQGFKSMGYDSIPGPGFQPDFTELTQYANKVSAANPSQGASLLRELNQVKSNWLNSGQTLHDLKNFQESAGTASAAFKGATDPTVSKIFKQLKYKTFAEPLQNAFDAVVGVTNPDLVGALKNANEQYAALKFYKKPVQNVKSGLGPAIKKNLGVSSFGESAIAGTLGYLAKSALPAEVLAAYKGAKILADTNPIRTAKFTGGAADLIEGVPNISGGLVSNPHEVASTTLSTLPTFGPGEYIDDTPEAQGTPVASPTPTDVSMVEGPVKFTSPKEDGNFTPIELDALRQVESGGGVNLLSSVGAQGPYQFMPDTAASYNLKDPFDEALSRVAAKKLLEDEYKALGAKTLAYAAYNAGRPAVLAAQAKARAAGLSGNTFEEIAPFFPKKLVKGKLVSETADYVPKIAVALQRLQTRGV